MPPHIARVHPFIVSNIENHGPGHEVSRETLLHALHNRFPPPPLVSHQLPGHFPHNAVQRRGSAAGSTVAAAAAAGIRSRATGASATGASATGAAGTGTGTGTGSLRVAIFVLGVCADQEVVGDLPRWRVEGGNEKAQTMWEVRAVRRFILRRSVGCIRAGDKVA